MRKNIGLADKILRIGLAILAYVLFFTGITHGVLALITIILGTIFGLTAMVNICPLYSIFGIKTCSNKLGTGC